MAAKGEHESVFDYQEFNVQAGINEEESHQPNHGHDCNAVIDNSLTTDTTKCYENKAYQYDGGTIEAIEEKKHGPCSASVDSTNKELMKNEVHFADLMEIENSSHSEEFKFNNTKEAGLKADNTDENTIEDSNGHSSRPQNINKEIEASVPDRKKERHSIIKNLLVICFSFMLLFTAFQSMSALQSSINKVGKLVKLHNCRICYVQI